MLGFPLAATHEAAEDSKGLSGFFLGAFFSPLAATHQAAFSAGSSSLGAHAHLSARVQGDANKCQKKQNMSLGAQAICLQGDANECKKK